MSQGLESVSLEQLYQVIPLLAYVPQEGLQQAQEQAAASDSMMGEQVGVTLARLFYEELGMDTAAIQSRYIWNKGLQMLGVALLGVIATVLVGFTGYLYSIVVIALIVGRAHRMPRSAVAPTKKPAPLPARSPQSSSAKKPPEA